MPPNTGVRLTNDGEQPISLLAVFSRPGLCESAAPSLLSTSHIDGFWRSWEHRQSPRGSPHRRRTAMTDQKKKGDRNQWEKEGVGGNRKQDNSDEVSRSNTNTATQNSGTGKRR
jgi:hypothetical protein